jgi:hypothetical protein
MIRGHCNPRSGKTGILSIAANMKRRGSDVPKQIYCSQKDNEAPPQPVSESPTEEKFGVRRTDLLMDLLFNLAEQ